MIESRTKGYWLYLHSSMNGKACVSKRWRHVDDNRQQQQQRRRRRRQYVEALAAAAALAAEKSSISHDACRSPSSREEAPYVREHARSRSKNSATVIGRSSRKDQQQ